MRDALYSLPPDNLPDTPETRRDMASYKASARSLDQGVGSVLNALDEHDLADDTLVILTTDHGLAFPGAKGTLYDRGIGVLLIMRGPGGAHGGRVSNALVSHVDLFPTICELAGIEPPARLQGRSLLPVMRREVEEVNDAIFAELTYHAAYEPRAGGAHRALEVHPPLRRPAAAGAPQRRRQPDQGPAARGRLGRRRAAARGAARPALRPGRGAQPDRRAALRGDRWTSCASAWTPGCARPRTRCSTARWPAPEGAELNSPDQISPAEPANGHVLDPAGSVH